MARTKPRTKPARAGAPILGGQGQNWGPSPGGSDGFAMLSPPRMGGSCDQRQRNDCAIRLAASVARCRGIPSPDPAEHVILEAVQHDTSLDRLGQNCYIGLFSRAMQALILTMLSRMRKGLAPMTILRLAST